MDDQTRIEIEAAAFRRLQQHLMQDRPDAQNIDMMNLAGFCRNCLSRWYQEAANARGIEMDKDAGREAFYGMPFAEWKAKHQTDASDLQVFIDPSDVCIGPIGDLVEVPEAHHVAQPFKFRPNPFDFLKIIGLPVFGFIQSCRALRGRVFVGCHGQFDDLCALISGVSCCACRFAGRELLFQFRHLRLLLRDNRAVLIKLCAQFVGFARSAGCVLLSAEDQPACAQPDQGRERQKHPNFGQ